MDPNAALTQALEEAHSIQDGETNDLEGAADDLATFVIELDNWIKKGGFLPTAWITRDPDPASASGVRMLCICAHQIGIAHTTMQFTEKMGDLDAWEKMKGHLDAAIAQMTEWGYDPRLFIPTLMGD